MTNPVSVGVAQLGSYTAAPGTWTLNPQPTVGNALILPYEVENPLGVTPLTVTITDNQGSNNSYNSIVVASNGNGSGGIGGLAAGVILCPIVVYSGTLQLTITVTGGSGRASYLINHVEVNGMTGNGDKIGTFSSGNAQAGSASVSASGQNSLATEFVVAALAGFNPTPTFTPLSDPPNTGYTTMGTGTQSGNATATAGAAGDLGYKVVSVLETSTAFWPVSGSWASSAFVCAAIATFRIGSGSPLFVPPTGALVAAGVAPLPLKSFVITPQTA